MKSGTRVFSINPALVRPFLIAAIACSFFVFAVPKAEASGLTEPQIQAVLNLISSFGADQATVANVEAALRGTTPPPSTPITVTAPNGGEQWEIGQLNTITWSPYSYAPTTVNGANDVSVYLERKDENCSGDCFSSVGRVMDTGKASLHTYFNLNDYNTWAQPGRYYVRAVNNKTGASDLSDAPFTLLPRPVDLKVNGSDGPLVIYDNQLLELKWRTTGMKECVIEGALRSSPNGERLPPFFVDVNGTKSLYAYVYSGSDYYNHNIHFTCWTLDGSRTVSDIIFFNVQANTEVSLRVTSPNGGESIAATDATQVKIAWRMDGISTPLSIALYKNDQWLFWIEKNVYLDKSTDGTYSYTWVPNAKGPVLPKLVLGGNPGYKIYITGQKADGTGYVDDKSDAPFSFAVGPTDWVGGCANPPVYTGPDAYVGKPYTYDPGVYNAGAPYPSLPAGLTKNNGIITGTPTVAGPVSVKVYSSNSCGAFRINFTVRDSASNTGTYKGYLDSNLSITTANISQADALANCKLNAANNPTSSIRCTWNDIEIYSAVPITDPRPSATPKSVFLTSGSSWTVPSDWNNNGNTVEVIGGGGQAAQAGRSGGGGGAYSKISNLALTSGNSVTYKVGAGGAGGSALTGGTGGDTYFNGTGSTCSTQSVCAKGGTGGQNTTDAPGGAAASGVGSVKYSGGTGLATHGYSGGGGGGAAGPNGNGNNGSAGGSPGSSGGNGGSGDAGFGGTGGSGGAPYTGNGGTGGNGTEWSASYGSGGGGGGGGSYSPGGNGGAPGSYGGGSGSAGNITTASPNGAQGVIVITYTPTLNFIEASASDGNANLASVLSTTKTFDYTGMVAAVAMVPFNILVDAFTDIFVMLGVGR